MNFEIGDVLEYSIGKNKYRCIIVYFNDLYKEKFTILSGIGTLWDEEIDNPSVEYTKVDHIDLSKLFGEQNET